MGEWNVSCGLSNLSVDGGDETGAILLIPSNTLIDYGSLIDFDAIEGDGLYKPFLSPVYGEYNSFGSLDDIKSSSATAMFKRMFGFDAYDVLYNKSSNTKQKKLFLKNATVMTFLVEVFENLKASGEFNYGFDELKAEFSRLKVDVQDSTRSPLKRKNVLKTYEDILKVWNVPTFLLDDFVAFDNFDELFETQQLRRMLFSGNRGFIPSFQGEQFGDNHFALKLSKISEIISLRRIEDEVG